MPTDQLKKQSSLTSISEPETQELKRKWRDLLIARGITDEKEIAQRLEDMLNPRRDLLDHVKPGSRVYPTEDGFLTMKQIVEKTKKKPK